MSEERASESPGASSEFDIIRWIRAQVGTNPAVPVGIGDDAAAVRMPPHTLAVLTTDMLIDGVHFHAAEVSPRQVGHKAVARCVSDIAAMAADGEAVVIAMSAPPHISLSYVQELFQGMKAAADALGVRIVGGDISSANQPLTLAVTALGSALEGAMPLRSGAKPGDALLVTGELGGSILGRHLDFLPRLRESRWLRQAVTLHSMIDISDGLAADAMHLVEESGVGIEVWEEAIPVSRAAEELAATTGRTPLEHALADGEDYELLFTVPCREAAALIQRPDLPVRITCIGEVFAGSGLWMRQRGKERQPLTPRGWVHRF